MIDSIKAFFSDLKGKLLAIGGVLLGILYLIANYRKKKYESVEAQLELADTHKQVDLVDAEIKHELETKDLHDKEIKELDDLKAKVDDKRKALDASPNLSDTQITDYWNNKK